MVPAPEKRKPRVLINSSNPEKSSSLLQVALSSTIPSQNLQVQQLSTMAAFPSLNHAKSYRRNTTAQPAIPLSTTTSNPPSDLLSLVMIADAVAAQRMGLARQYQQSNRAPTVIPRRPPPPSRPITEREHFLLFVKVLFKCIEQADNPRLRQLAKAVVSDCTRRNRRMGGGGDNAAASVPLQEAVEERLRSVVGEVYWTQAKLYVDSYCKKRGIRRVVNATTVAI